MRIRRTSSTLLWFSIGSLLLALVLLAARLISFSQSRATYPPNLIIANVPVGNLSRQEATQRLLEVYNIPVELHYSGAIIHLDPAIIGFQLNLESMLAAADLTRTGGPFWNEFWDYLWGSAVTPDPIPLDSTYDENLLRSYLENEIGMRYDQPAIPARPLVGQVIFQPGEPGSEIDIDRAVFQIENALRSPTNRFVDLAIVDTQPGRPSFYNLKVLLEQLIDIEEYEGIAGLYLIDLQTAQEIHFILNNGVEYTTMPDLAFTASSIIKIPIMVSAYRHLGEDPTQEAINLLEGMIEQSGNDPADWLMEQFIDFSRGPLIVTEDMRALGLESTFLAGYFRIGSPLMAYFTTPGNSRTDITTSPDPYNQTTVSEIGMLLADIYQCAETGGGALVAVFSGEITQRECKEMIEIMTANKLGSLIEGGAPEGTKIAHKHGWVSDVNTGAITTIGDAGIVYTPSGNYVLVIYFYHPVQLVWDPISSLIGDLAAAVYNYYNLPAD